MSDRPLPNIRGAIDLYEAHPSEENTVVLRRVYHKCIRNIERHGAEYKVKHLTHLKRILPVSFTTQGKLDSLLLALINE